MNNKPKITYKALKAILRDIVIKFNPYHDNIGRFTTAGSNITGAVRLAPEKQSALTKEIDALNKQYGTLYRQAFKSDDPEFIASSRQQLRDISAMRNALLTQRERNKRLSIDVAVRTIATRNSARGARLGKIMEAMRAS